MNPRNVMLEIFEDDGCWWAKLRQRGTPVAPGQLPNLGQALLWSGSTREQAQERAFDFITQAYTRMLDIEERAASAAAVRARRDGVE